ncbi:MAG TPA: methylmalonyl Co-A mutase-associated GTPase MeaB, partial [Acidobacteriota bacterium]
KIAHTTVVVLMPGLGDEVQAMKAGLMEIADILVINKADREDADKLQMELESTLSFFQPGASTEAWKPRILKTVALNNTGVEALAKAIDDHRRHLKSTGKLHERLLLQSRQRLIDALEYQVVSHFIQEGFDKFGISQKIEEIAARRTDPHSVVQELIKHFKMD